MEELLSKRTSRFHAIVQQVDQQLQYEASTIARHQARIKQLESEKAELLRCIGVIDRCVQIISANGIGKIEGIVTDGLRQVFGNDQLGLVIEKKETARGNTYRILIQDGETIGNPMDSFGGGVQNVAAFLLRVILIKRFKLAKFLALDEQFSNVSPEYQARVAQLLKTLAGLGFTLLTVSHQPAITGGADQVYQLTVHCPGCGHDLTPAYPYTDPVPNPCPGCELKRVGKARTLPRLNKVEGLRLEELSGPVAEQSSAQTS